MFFFFSSRRRHTRFDCDWSDVCSSDLWPKPHEKELNKALSRQPLRLAPITGDGRELVERLLSVFHNLGQVSLILRFVHAETFGIFSTPIVNLLQIHRPRTVDLYLDFCN